jgi:putative ABC transport system permease protein
MDDVEYLQRQVSQIDLVAPIVQIPSREVTNGDKEVKNSRVFASNENFDELNRMNVTDGRQLDQSDMNLRSNVCVVGPEIAERLFNKQALGKTLQLRGITLEVVGVFERFDMMGDTNARDVLVPITTAQDKWLGGETVTYITTRPKKGYDTAGTVEQVWQAMMRKSNNKRIYRVDSRESILQLFGVILGSAGTLLAGIAGLSLLVGGIGIMNIMLVSVTERTREIGLRKAVGAKRASILIQFLVEAIVLSMFGGAIGMLIAAMIGQSITLITAGLSWPTKAGLSMPFPLTAAALALGFSALIGIIFGFFPAMSASKLNPIDALRKE